MGEKVMLVCDVCGKPAEDTASIKIGGRSLSKDLCAQHVAELTQGARTPKRGRKKAVTIATPAKRRGRPPKGVAAANAGRTRKPPSRVQIAAPKS